MIQKRVRYFLAGEGPGDQSFIRWLQILADKNGLHIHLDCEPLTGGSYETMLKKAVYLKKRNDKTKTKAKACILLVDSDRATQRDDGWSLAQLKEAAEKENFIVCVQRPNQEGILLRLLTGKANLELNTVKTKEKLNQAWPTYKKPVDAYTLSAKFSIEDLARAAKVDPELKILLLKIGLVK